MYSLKIIIATLFCCYLVACQSTNLGNKTSNQVDKEEFLLSKTSIERLMLLQEGHFILHDSSGQEPFIMKSGDSLCLYSKQIGVVDRDGYWLFQKVYMSSVPDVPLSMEFLKIGKVSRDSFFVEQFDAEKIFANADRNPTLLENINFKKLKAIDCNIVFEKVNQLEFKGKTPVCDLSYEGGGGQIFVNFFFITMEGIKITSHHYKKEEGKNVLEYTTYGRFQ